MQMETCLKINLVSEESRLANTDKYQHEKQIKKEIEKKSLAGYFRIRLRPVYLKKHEIEEIKIPISHESYVPKRPGWK
jgi:hypothetical protein